MATAERLRAKVDEARSVLRGNYDANEIEDVYVPAEIIGADILDAIPIMDWQEKVREGTNITVPSRFVAHRISRVAGNDNAKQRLKVLRYLLFLIVFLVTLNKAKVRGVKVAPRRKDFKAAIGEDGWGSTPDSVLENIRRRFTSCQEKELGELRKTHMDMLMTTCCALAAIVDGFEVEMRDLQEDLKMEGKMMGQYFMEIGARIKKSKSSGIVTRRAELQLPLAFPRVKVPARRR